MAVTNREQDELDVAELKAQLAEAHQALQTRDEALRQLHAQISAPMPPISPNTTCSFLKKLPLEMRNQVYGLVLINEDLATFRELSEYDDYRTKSFQYGLAPALLRTCRQINKEGSKVLYESNVFLIYFRNGLPWTPLVQPLRYDGTPAHLRNISGLLNLPNFQRVKQWKVLINVKSAEYLKAGVVQDQDRFLTYFCRILCISTPQSLDVVVRPGSFFFGKCAKANDWKCTPGSEFLYDELKPFLEPLNLLRKVTRFSLGGTAGTEFPPQPPSSEELDEASIQPRKVPWHIADRIKLLVEGESLVALPFKMTDRLLSYAQAFEWNDTFRKNMDPDSGRKCDGWPSDDYDLDPYGNRVVYDWKMPDFCNPFLRTHPVEVGLSRAHSAAYRNKISQIKTQRELVVMFLEPQYQRIAVASTVMAQFIKREKRANGNFRIAEKDHDTKQVHLRFYAEAVVHLEDYAKAFARDVPPSIRYAIRLVQSRFDVLSPCGDLVKPVSKLLGQLQISSDGQREFFRRYRKAVDALDKRFLQIRQARKDLFDYDIDNPECDIDLELGRCDEMIDWTVDEPDTDIPKKPWRWTEMDEVPT
jgi:hypothetical protein